jgi:hypothetical protein
MKPDAQSSSEKHTLPDSFIHEVNASGAQIVAFSVVRNEILRIPAWLRHYRALGVRLFAIVDNGSTDGTFEHLAEQHDVVLTRVDHSFAGSQFGIQWLNEFHNRTKANTWILFADADEFLVYRNWPNSSLATITDMAAAEGANAFFGLLLDMYPRCSIDDAALSTGDDPFEIAPCFDRDYCFRLQPRKPWAPAKRILEVVGGPRVRMLSSYDRERSSTWIARFCQGQIDRILPVTPDLLLPWLVRLFPRQMPSLSKAPLVLSGSGVKYVNNHDVEGAVLFRENVVLCHFKFLADFAARVRQEASRGEHYRRGAEYIMYADALSDSRTLTLTYDGSMHFDNVDQLIKLDIIRDIRPLLA